MTRQETEERVRVFRALADATRLGLVGLLCRQRRPDALCVNALANRLGVTQSAVSQHLRVLKGIGLVEGERQGYRVHYFINHETLRHCRELVLAALTVEGPGGTGNACEERDPVRGKQDIPAGSS